MSFDETLDRIKVALGVRTQVELANLLGIRQSSISDAKRRNSVPAEWLLKLYRTRGLNPDWLLDGLDPAYLGPEDGTIDLPASAGLTTQYGASNSKTRTVNVSTMVGQGEKDSWVPDMFTQLTIPESYYKSSIVVVVADTTCMYPIIQKDAFIGVDRDRKQIRSGEMFALHMPFEGMIIRRAFMESNNERVSLRSANPIHPDMSLSTKDATSRIIGRVAWLLQSM